MQCAPSFQSYLSISSAHTSHHFWQPYLRRHIPSTFLSALPVFDHTTQSPHPTHLTTFCNPPLGQQCAPTVQPQSHRRPPMIRSSRSTNCTTFCNPPSGQEYAPTSQIGPSTQRPPSAFRLHSAPMMAHVRSSSRPPPSSSRSHIAPAGATEPERRPAISSHVSCPGS